MLKSLIRKDLRISRLPLIAGVVLLLGPHVIAALAITRSTLFTEATLADGWATILATGSYFSLMCSHPTLAMLSGSIIAYERADRSAEFLAYLPPSRRQVLTSKLAVLFGASLIIWAGNLCLMLMASGLASGSGADTAITETMPALHALINLSVVSVGTGWLASSMLRSTGPGVALAFMAPGVIYGLVHLARYLTGWFSLLQLVDVYFATCWVAGLTCFFAGSVYFLKRIEP